jgi:hypothetical protein
MDTAVLPQVVLVQSCLGLNHVALPAPASTPAAATIVIGDQRSESPVGSVGGSMKDISVHFSLGDFFAILLPGAVGAFGMYLFANLTLSTLKTLGPH